MRGRLIAFEGIDGCGKTTQARLLATRIGEPDVLLSVEPGATALGAGLRRLLLDPALPPVSPRAEALLLAADRAEHVSQIVVPALEEGRWVVSDRYAASTLAYQGYGRGLDLDELRRLVAFATGGLEADLNVLLVVPPEVAAARVSAADADRLEQLGEDFRRRVAEGYDALAAAQPRRWAVVDGTGSVADVATRVDAALVEHLGPLPERAR